MGDRRWARAGRAVPPICIGRDRDQLMADSVHIVILRAGEPPGLLRSTAHSRCECGDDPAPCDCVSRLAAGWSLTLAVLAVLIRSSLARRQARVLPVVSLWSMRPPWPASPSGGDSPTWAGSGETAQDLSGETPSMTRRQPTL